MRMREQDLERNWMHKKVFSHMSEISKSIKQVHFVPGGPARVLTYLCFFVSSFFLWSPPSSRFKTWPQDSTSRSTCSRSLLFYSSDFHWSPFMFNVRELSYLKNLMHPGTVYSTSSVDPNPSLNMSHALRWLWPRLSLECNDLTVPQLILTIHISIVCWSSHP